MLLSTDNTTVAANLNKGGWGQVSDIVIYGNQATAMVCKATSVSDSQMLTRQTECARRFSLAEGSAHSHRMDPSQEHAVSDFSLLGSPTHRSVCHEIEQPTTGF